MNDQTKGKNMSTTTERPPWWPSEAQKLRAELTTKTPAEIDTQLFPILDKIDREARHRADAQRRLDGTPRRPGEHVWPLRDFERPRYEQMVAQHDAKIVELEAEATPLEREYSRRAEMEGVAEGWTRYIVVPGGHLHKRACHTLTPGRTMVGQVAEASGLDEDEVVGKYDEQACTHCFPDAPVAAKKTPAEEGLCEHSGTYADPETYLTPRGHYCQCACGARPSVTSTGKIRRHKAGAQS